MGSQTQLGDDTVGPDENKRYGTKRQDAGTRRTTRRATSRKTSRDDQARETQAREARVRETRSRERSPQAAERRSRSAEPARREAVARKPREDAAASSVLGTVRSALGTAAGAARGAFGSLAGRFGAARVAVVTAVVVLAVALGVNHLARIRVTVNDQQLTVGAGTRVGRLLDRGVVTVTPGDLLAVDGSVITEGGGDRCSVTINGDAADATSRLSRGDVVTIGDGDDVTEEFTSTESPVAHGSVTGDTSFASYWNGSIHLLSDGQDGVLTTRTGTVSGKTASEETTPAIDAGYHVYTADTGGDKVIALTFDDGPWPETTDAILDILEEYGAKATFFTIGNQIAEHPDQVRRAVNLGCQVCTHTWDHAAGTGGGVNICYMSAEEQVSEVTKGLQAIQDVTGVEPAHIMRAPGGNFYDDAISNLWPYLDAEIGWDVDTEDWSLPGSDHIAQMIESAKPGQVVLMHDGGGDRWQTVEGLKEAMPYLVEQGYSFVTIDELLAYGTPSATE